MSGWHAEATEWKHAPLPFQLPSFVDALTRCQAGAASLVNVPDIGDLLLSTSSLGVTSLIEGGGFLPKADPDLRSRQWLALLGTQLQVATLYFPLVYEGCLAFDCLSRQVETVVLERRPTCLIHYPLPEGTLLSRCASRIGDRAYRRIVRFEKADGAAVWLCGQEAIAAMHAIETSSWKHRCGQDMVSRKQFGFFSDLVGSGSVTMRAARVGNAIVAYRLDCRVGSAVYVLKWSFDEHYRALSPGFYLIVRDLDACYATSQVQYIDLYGSPDSLKEAVSDRYVRRYDFIWPPGPESKAILQDRERHDRQNSDTYRSGAGIRVNYGG